MSVCKKVKIKAQDPNHNKTTLKLICKIEFKKIEGRTGEAAPFKKGRRCG